MHLELQHSMLCYVIKLNEGQSHISQFHIFSLGFWIVHLEVYKEDAYQHLTVDMLVLVFNHFI